MNEDAPYIPIICVLPDFIEIVVPPEKLTYAVGENIDITGMVVFAYFYDGTEWGQVDNDELTITPSTADEIGTTEITVSWKRPTDEKELTTTFGIEVTE